MPNCQTNKKGIISDAKSKNKQKIKMIQKGSRVRHIDPSIDKIKGIMIVFEIKNGIALCGYGDYQRFGQGMENYKVTELKLSE